MRVRVGSIYRAKELRLAGGYYRMFWRGYYTQLELSGETKAAKEYSGGLS
jgi:hypothetical protein